MRLLEVFRNLLLLLLIMLASCQTTKYQIEPTLIYSPECHQIKLLPSAFPPLTFQEKKEDWGRELIIGNQFAKDFDFYRAITAYKRAQILIDPSLIDQLLQIDYNIILCYFLANKYQEVIDIFENSELTRASGLFPAFHNLLIILYESYLKLNQDKKACLIFEIIEKGSFETAKDLSLYKAVNSGDLLSINAIVAETPSYAPFGEFLCSYEIQAKSPRKAQILNAVIPGAGYYYVGQKKSALTSFLINTLFTWAAYQFYSNGYIAAGVITTSLELGWYLGGINGAGLEAREYNNILYNTQAKQVLTKECLFPILMFETAF